MPLWRCDWDNCTQPAVQRAGDCPLCGRHLCRIHLQGQWHTCPDPEVNWKDYCALYVAAENRHMAELCRRIDGSNLRTRVSLLRGGTPCTVDLSPKNLSAMMGGQNCHAEIAFQDGVKWLARFRIVQTSSPPLHVRDFILRSEVATMNYLQSHTHIPLPRILDWACESDPDNPLGQVGYIFMEKMGGTPLDWQQATPSQRDKVMWQLADVFLEIEKHPFDAIGSIMSAGEQDNFKLQGLAHHSAFYGEADDPLGPFSSSLEAARTAIDKYVTMISTGEIGASYPIDIFLAHRFRLDILNGEIGDGRLFLSEGPFFLKHPDDKGDHILVSENSDIVGNIDWEWCRTVAKEDAFSSPCMMWPVAEFYDGSNELSEDEVRFASIFRERGREDLAGCVLNGRRVQRFFFALGAASEPHPNPKTFIGLFTGLRRAFGTEEEWQGWKIKALEKWKSDEVLLNGLR